LRHTPAAVTAVLLMAAGFSIAAHARPFTDPRSERNEAFDADPAFAAAPRDAACHAAVLAATGGAVPKNPHTLAIRWIGYSNFELSYNGQVILLDAYYDRGTTYAPLGFAAADVRRADAILIGHGHFDHMADAASVGARTGATVVGAPVTTDKLATQNIDARQVRTVTGRGGEALQLGAFKVEPILARHGEPPANRRPNRRRAEIRHPTTYAGAGSRVRRHPRPRHAGSARDHRRHPLLPDHAGYRLSHPLPRQRRPRHRIREGRDGAHWTR
jgi:hypothetical protein